MLIAIEENLKEHQMLKEQIEEVLQKVKRANSDMEFDNLAEESDEDDNDDAQTDALTRLMQMEAKHAAHSTQDQKVRSFS